MMGQVPPTREGAILVEDSVIRAFSEDHVARLTGLSKRQLRYWDKTGFFRPNYTNEAGPYGRIYSLRDVVGLRTLSLLRDKVSLQHLRTVAAELSHLEDRLWSETTLYVFNNEVHFREPDTGQVRGAVSRQYVTIPLVGIMNDVSEAARKLKERAADKVGRIERNRYVAHNAPVVAGTRIPIRTIKSFGDAGYSIEAIMGEYPSLNEADVRAALEYDEKAERAA
jgi:uncharacterized protein (DUF433 family)